MSLNLPRPPAWTEHALCAEVGAELFWPDKGDYPLARQAIRVCGACQVRDQCLAYAIENHEAEGIWGGVMPRQRRGMRGAA